MKMNEKDLRSVLCGLIAKARDTQGPDIIPNLDDAMRYIRTEVAEVVREAQVEVLEEFRDWQLVKPGIEINGLLSEIRQKIKENKS